MITHATLWTKFLQIGKLFHLWHLLQQTTQLVLLSIPKLFLEDVFTEHKLDVIVLTRAIQIMIIPLEKKEFNLVKCVNLEHSWITTVFKIQLHGQFCKVFLTVRWFVVEKGALHLSMSLDRNNQTYNVH